MMLSNSFKHFMSLATCKNCGLIGACDDLSIELRTMIDAMIETYPENNILLVNAGEFSDSFFSLRAYHVTQDLTKRNFTTNLSKHLKKHGKPNIIIIPNFDRQIRTFFNNLDTPSDYRKFRTFTDRSLRQLAEREIVIIHNAHVTLKEALNKPDSALTDDDIVFINKDR